MRWISHHSSLNPTVVATRLGRDSKTHGEKNPSHMENHTKCISCKINKLNRIEYIPIQTMKQVRN